MYMCIWHIAHMILRRYLKLMHHPSQSSAWPNAVSAYLAVTAWIIFIFVVQVYGRNYYRPDQYVPKSVMEKRALPYIQGELQRLHGNNAQMLADESEFEFLKVGTNRKTAFFFLLIVLQMFEALLPFWLLPSGVSAVARIWDFALSRDAWEKAPRGWDHPRCLCQRCRRLRNERWLPLHQSKLPLEGHGDHFLKRKPHAFVIDLSSRRVC